MTPAIGTVEKPVLYASWGCPFSHRTLAALHFVGLSDKIDILFVEDVKREDGWRFDPAEPVFGARNVPELYSIALPGQDNRPSVPILADRIGPKIVSTESLDIMRWIATGFDGQYDVPHDLCPVVLRREIADCADDINSRITRAVYRVGLTKDQEVYDRECRALFAALDTFEARLSKQPYLMGNTLTEADLVLFPTLARFDAIYAPLFRCSLRRIADYPALSRYLKGLLEVPGLAASFDLHRAKNNYFRSIIHRPDGAFEINPSGIVPL